ncbi:Ribulokinase [Spirochaeta thermophila DSM 6578]|uniref:Ribulokinase n=1 Tax=Winmispira thermophila (strain ATCC 700085 / DSM 6578 / Z-1203) TaxID=869211 RepID=G0GF08_WINT7|nr:ribulokinase [Spirochaeta thermophila]AEJ62352.1 Ribulokinase [Spirochaeta thermophila DSM 6578]
MTGSNGDLVLGMDFGTDSCRAVLIDLSNGSEVASHVAYYRRWKEGAFCNPRENRFRQHPLDYLEAMEEAVRGAVEKAGAGAGDRVVGIGIDTTGSTPCACDEKGRPLALDPAFAEDPDAMFILWKDHTAAFEAVEITKKAGTWGGTDYTKFIGGVYSAEWFWAKILHVFRTNERIMKEAYTFIEHCDWMPALLTGVEDAAAVKRSRCAMGHKAMWHREWGGYPSDEFLSLLHPELPRIRASLGTETWTSDVKAGELTPEWAKRLGLRPGIAVAVGAYDAHMGAVGAGVKPGVLVKVVGTSTCDITVGPRPDGPEHAVGGICGQVDGSVIPGLIGYEAGQSAFGDVYAWFKRVLLWPLRVYADKGMISRDVLTRIDDSLLVDLEAAAAALELHPEDPVALDWFNGRRTPYANQLLTGAVAGLDLGVDASLFYRILIEGTVFGSKAIVDRFREEGVEIESIVGIGGVARKSPLVMQMMADVLGAPIDVLANDQTVAIGAGLFGAVAAGVFSSVEEAQEVMVPPVERTYVPEKSKADLYAPRYEKYRMLGRFIESEFTTYPEEGRES